MIRNCANPLSLFVACGFALHVEASTQPLAPGASIATTSAVVPEPPVGDAADVNAVLPMLGASLAVADPPVSFPGLAPTAPVLPQVFAPTRPRTIWSRYPWKRYIVATVFWIGEKPTVNNPVSNAKSAWDRKWTESYGGYDDPKTSGREGFLPKDFTPQQNPFYIALPYNDIAAQGVTTKTSARHAIPWFDEVYERSGKTIIKGRWVAIRLGPKVCYAQWEDVGPFETDDWQYVFGDARPKTKGNGGAGIDVSPAIRDYLGFDGRAVCDWRFVDENEVPEGPWRTHGDNNPFLRRDDPSSEDNSRRIVRLRALRDQYLSEMPGRAFDELP